MYLHIYVYENRYILLLHVYINMYVHTYTYVCIYICTYIYIYKYETYCEEGKREIHGRFTYI
jgi:hypothetical protein